jgi:hypothetical protein
MAIFPAAYDVEIDNTGTVVGAIASVQIAGTPVAGSTVTATVTTAPLGATVAYQWRLDGAPIDGATAASLAVLDAMDGGVLSLRLSPQGGTPVIVELGPVRLPAPAIVGDAEPNFGPANAETGATLTGTPGTWDPAGTVVQQIIRLNDPLVDADDEVVATGDGSGPITHVAAVAGQYRYRETATTSGGSTIRQLLASVSQSEDAVSPSAG